MPARMCWGSVASRPCRTLIPARTLVAVQAIQPDVAVIHVQEADAEGNAVIYGTRFEDVLAAQAARRVMITCERIVEGYKLARRPK